jgi:hypothetical protein
MSGGGIGNQNHDDDRQVVIITFSGALDPQTVKDWNQTIKNFQTNFGESMSGVTLKGTQKSAQKPAHAKSAQKSTKRRSPSGR